VEITDKEVNEAPADPRRYTMEDVSKLLEKQ
jgi:hypothetical protein